MIFLYAMEATHHNTIPVLTKSFLNDFNTIVLRKLSSDEAFLYESLGLERDVTPALKSLKEYKKGGGTFSKLLEYEIFSYELLEFYAKNIFSTQRLSKPTKEKFAIFEKFQEKFLSTPEEERSDKYLIKLIQEYFPKS